MKFLNHNLFTGDITVNGTTTLSTATGVTRPTGDNTTHLATTAFVKAQDYATNTALGNYVPISRTLTINNVTYDLSANRSWTIGTSDYTSVVKHAVKAGVAITKGQAVYVTSADGTNMIVGLASNTSEATSSKTMGLAETTVAANGFTNVITEGLLAGLDTSTAGTEGDPVWLGVNGNLIYGLLNKPYAPAHLVFIGIVTRKNANNGEIFVKVQNGFELKEIHDVDLITTAPINGHLLGYNGTLWVNKTIAGWLGYTPANASGTTNYLSKFTGSTTLGNSQVFDNGTNVGIGTTSPTNTLDVLGSATIRNSSGGGALNIGTNSGRTEYQYITLGGGTGGTDYGWQVGRSPQTGGIINDGFYIYDIKTGNAPFAIALGGNVGIGTLNPSGQLSGTKGLSIVDATNAALGLSNGTNNWLNYLSGTTYRIWNNSSSEVMTITLAGNVGIGTTSPYGRLELSGSGQSWTTAPAIRMWDSFNSTGWIVGNVNNITAGDFYIRTLPSVSGTPGSGQQEFTIKHATGNVGIGTTSPTEKLHVGGRVRIATIDNGTGDFATISGTGVITRRTAAQVLSDIGAQPSGSYLTAEADTLATVTGRGASTSTAITIQGGWASTILNGDNVVLRKPNYSSGGWARTLLNFQEYTTTSLFQIGGYGSNNVMTYGYLGSAYNTPTFRWYANKDVVFDGNVGLGVVGPGNKLVVDGVAQSTIAKFYTSDNNYSTVEVGDTGDVYASVYMQTDSGNGQLFKYGAGWGTESGMVGLYSSNGPIALQAGGSTKVFVQSGGNVGIGTTSPGTKLDVNGVITATGGNSTQWNTAYGWGNHASAGYLTSLPAHTHDDRYYTETESDARYPLSRGVLGTTTNVGDSTGFGNNLASGTYTRTYVGHSGQVWMSHDTGGSTGNFALEVTYYGAMYVHTNVDSSSWVTKQIWTAENFTLTNISNWNTAYGWGNHASQGYATQTYVNTAIANLVDSAPSTLDTLNELAAALGDDPNFATTVTNSIAAKLPLAGGTMTGKIFTVSTGTGTYDTAIEIREQGYVTTSQSAWGYSPAMTFHWGGRHAIRFGLRSDGLMAVDDAPIALRSWVTSQGYLTAESDTLATVTGRGASTSTDLTFNGTLTMGTGGTQYIRMGRFPASVTNTGEAWIGRASDRSTGTMTVQLGNDAARIFEIVDHAWSTVILNVGMNSFSYKGNTIWHAGNDGAGSGLDADLWDGYHVGQASNWASRSANDIVVGMMSWRNYGNSHVIFDASASLSPAGTAVNNTTPQVLWTGTYPTLMGWNGTNTYGVRVDVSRASEYATSAGNADTVDSLHASDFVRAYTTTADNIDSDWGQSFKTFDPVPSGTPPIASPNLRTINVGNDFNRRTQLAFTYATDQAWFRRRDSSGWQTWREFIHSGNIASQSVSYATTAGALTSMNISQFTNNSGYIAAGSTVSEAAVWTGATKFRSAGDISQAAGNHALQIFADVNNDAFMAFHISNDYAVHFGLDDSTNRLYVGGWSDGTGTKYQMWDSRDFSSTNISNWNTAYGWGNHASAGYQAASTAITTSNIGSQSVSNATTVGGITPIQFFNNMGDSHGTRTSFDASTPSYNFGFRFIQGNTNGPALGGGGQFYSWYLGLGNDYPATGAGSYGMHVAIPRSAVTPYMSVRYNENNSLGSWIKIAAGYADTAGALSSMNISQFTNNSGYITGYTETNTFLGDGGSADTHPGTDRIIFTGQLSLGAAVLGMPSTDNSNAILNINRHPGEYNSQLGFSSNGSMYYRSFSATAINSTQAWRQVWDSGNLTNLNQLTNGPGYITGNQTITLSGDVSGSGTTSIVVTVNNIDGWGFVNTGSNSATDADSINSNGISYYTAGVTNFSGNATDGALYSQRYGDSWQHQIAGDYRSGMIAVRGKNNGTWTTWKTIIDSSTIGSQSVSFATSATQVVTIQDNPPTGVNGKLWWESDTGKLKVYYGSSSAWVDATPVPDMSLYYAKAGGPISGDVTIQQTLTVVGNTLIQGTLTETSDISLKENILPLESSLDKVMKLNGVSFNKKATPNVKEIGFIAQEVEAVIPDLVTETNEGIKTVSYSRVTAVLVETIKEQQAQIEELKNMVNMLAEKLNSL